MNVKYYWHIADYIYSVLDGNKNISAWYLFRKVLFDVVFKYTGQSFFFWEANNSSPNQEILRILSKPNVCYRVHNPPLVSVLSQNNPSTPPLSFLNIHFNIIPLSIPKPSKFSPNKHVSLSHSCYMLSPWNSSRCDHANNIWLGVEIMKLHRIQSSPLPCYIFPLRPGCLPHLIILKHLQTV